MAWKRSKVTGKPNDKAAYKSIAAQCSDSIRKYHGAKELKMIRKDNLGSFFNFVNGKLKTCSKLNDICRSDNTLCHDKEEISCIFNNFFASVFTVDNGLSPKFTDRVNVHSTCLSSINFSPSRVKKALRALKPTTSTGLDGIPNVFLKNCANSLSIPLSHIFDTSFKDGAIPLDWKVASVIPIHKKGLTVDPGNYRPISLTSTCCRLMGRIINNKLINYLLLNNLIRKEQHGFIRKRSTCTNILESLHDWTLNLQRCIPTDIIYFDFKKAFHSVSHPKLLMKLLAYGK
ncbi:uncharacterized protein LOC105846644 [Hydra vulgaris]|uniref:uncharacterized protein LOC105846644 n=1 Tax=Hydra vulgaris TaxID=6087 RepID=UPI001F5E8961|nr:uncharacterized protein LOC105846644 [Hydra vulgaris]